MKIFLVFIVIAAIVFGMWYFTPHDTDTAYFEVIFNEYRRSQGLEPLVFTEDLNRIAALRLEEIKNDYSHSSQGGYNKYLGENIVDSIRSNEEALKSWRGSWLHNANLLNSDCKYTGYAAATQLFGGGYAVQVFSEWITVNGVPQLPQGWHFDY